MNTSTRRAICLLTILLLFIIAGLACRGRRSANEKRYDLKGKVIAVDKLNRTATIAHEEIPGYMPAMTMPFQVKSDGDLEMMKPGNLITGDLVVDGSSSWIEVSTVTDSAPNDPNVDVPGEPKRGDEVPDFGLVNQDGQRIHLAQYRGKALVLTFIYTRCPLPDYCPLMSENFHQIDQELEKDPTLYAKTHLLSISFDAEYDTPKVLRSYGAAHTGRYSDETFQHWEFATGTPDEVKGVAQYFGLQYYHDTQSGQDQMIHSLRTAVISADGKLLKVYRGNEWKPDDIVTDLRALVSK
jgi:protein SCO1/2